MRRRITGSIRKGNDMIRRIIVRGVERLAARRAWRMRWRRLQRHPLDHAGGFRTRARVIFQFFEEDLKDQTDTNNLF